MKFILVGMVTAVCLVGSVAVAQSAQDESGVSPDSEMLNFKNWAVQCSRLAESSIQACAMFQRLKLDNGQHILTAQLVKQVIDQDKPEPVDTIIFTVPWGVHLRRGLAISIDGGELRKLSYERCDPQGCYAGMLLSEKILSEFKAGNKMKVSFVEPRGQAVTVPVSLLGFTAAYKAFHKQNES